MKKNQYSDYENYILLCDNSRGFKLSYTFFLNFAEVKRFLKQISSVTSDTFNYDGDIYNKKVTSQTAESILNSLAINNRCDYSTFKSVANQLEIPV